MSGPEPVKLNVTGEKQEKSRGEKNWDEKWRKDPLNAAAWALILIWLGLTLLANSLGLLKGWGYFSDWSHLFFLGAGAILILEAIFRLLVPAYRRPVLGTLILGILFLAISLGDLNDQLWPYVLAIGVILIGLAVLFRGLFRKRE